MKKIRYIPYGYTMRNGRTVISTEEAEIIREIFKAYLDGASLKAIAEELTGRQIPYTQRTTTWDKARIARIIDNAKYCALPGFVDSKNEEKTERNAGYLVVSHSGGGMLRQGTRKGIRRTPANRGMRAHWVVKGLDISEDVCHGMCP